MADNTNINETASVSVWPTIWKFSLIIAACSFAYTLVLYFTGLATSSGFSLLWYVIFIVLLVLAMRTYRSLNGGYMTFGAATLIGIITSIVSSAISSTLNAIYLAFIDDSILGEMLAQTEAALSQTPGITEDSLEMMMGLYENFLFTPVGVLAMGILSGVIAGVIISLILAAILKKAPPIAG